MTDETKGTPAQPEEPAVVAEGVIVDDAGVEAVGAVAVQGNYVVLAAQFADMDSAKLAYATARSAVVTAQANLQTARDAMEDTQVRAPITGTTDRLMLTAVP